MQRRHFMFTLSGVTLAFATRSFAASGNDKVTIMRFSDDGKALGRVTLAKVRNDAEWKKRLPPLAYQVTREQGTERAFSQPGYDRHEPGLYRCVCCDNALFDAKTKYDSHTGWPSFWQPIAAENVREIADRMFGMMRTVRCAPGPCIRRWPETDRVALLHEYGGDALRSEIMKPAIRSPSC